MSGGSRSIQAFVKQKSPHCVWTHDVRHREALASKEMNPILNATLTTVVIVVNCVKNEILKSRIFSALCKDMGAANSVLLFYCEARWLSRGKYLQLVYELKKEVAIFLKEENRREAEKFKKWFVCNETELLDRHIREVKYLYL
ncbi:protein FAM200A-like [Schistocerca nitens]|uniref:protein FAM200A-like n=1 Tax=Schistocerca nitens TaxID=7011 RepID=UPI0021199853|nr:protein FAM200A-like [Schistocerca nitens]